MPSIEIINLTSEGVIRYVQQIADFGQPFARVIRDHGALFESAPLPAGIKQGVKKQCFMNAGRLALARPDLIYCEGYAKSVIPVEHAWCIDQQGRVIDPTWDEPESCIYVGVAFKPDWFFDYIHRAGVWGVIGGEMVPKEFMADPDAGLLDLSTLGMPKGLRDPQMAPGPKPASGRGPGL